MHAHWIRQARQLRGERARDLVYRTEKEDHGAVKQQKRAQKTHISHLSFWQDPKKNQSRAQCF